MPLSLTDEAVFGLLGKQILSNADLITYIDW
jgi:hypothetical protein